LVAQGISKHSWVRLDGKGAGEGVAIATEIHRLTCIPLPKRPLHWKRLQLHLAVGVINKSHKVLMRKVNDIENRHILPVDVYVSRFNRYCLGLNPTLKTHGGSG
jgi:hypothetical protein